MSHDESYGMTHTNEELTLIDLGLSSLAVAGS